MGNTYSVGEGFKAAIDEMQRYVDAIEKEMDTIFNEMETCCVKEHQYKPLYQIGVSMEKTYNEQVCGAIKKAINEWAVGNASYVAYTKKFKMGDEAETEAERQQQLILGEIEKVKERNAIGSANPNFTDSHFVIETLKNKLEEISGKAKTIDTISEQHQEQLKKLAEDNTMVESLVAVGITYGKGISSFIAQATEKISSYMKGELDQIEKDMDTSVEQAAKDAEKFASSMEAAAKAMEDAMASLFS